MIKSIDLYSGNDELHFSFDKLILEGYTGVIFKAGQGELPDVPRVKPTWWVDAKKSGLDRGWYWLKDARHRSSLEFEVLKRATNLDFGELGMFVDCEKPRLGMSDRVYWTLPYSGYDDIYDLMVRIQNTKVSQFNQNLPGVYTAPGFWKLLNVPAPAARWFAQAPLWTAQYPWIYTATSKPTMYGAWTKPMWWQYREGPDINIFMGTDLEYQAMTKPVPIPTPQPVTEDQRFEKWWDVDGSLRIGDAKFISRNGWDASLQEKR